jgi:transcriptional regulator with XRE-family HTH domain
MMKSSNCQLSVRDAYNSTQALKSKQRVVIYAIMSAINALGEELRRLRELAGQGKRLSLRDIESRTGISNEYLSQLERGVAARPGPDVLQKLAQCYGVPYESLLVAAGYLREGGPTKRGARPVPRDVEAIASTAKFTEDEWREVKDFMSFVAGKRRHSDR